VSSQAVTPRRLTALILPVCLAGLGVLTAAGYVFATTGHSPRALVSLAALTAAATLAERFPVPINSEKGGGVISLTFVFAVAAIVLFGWAAGALLLLTATSIIQLWEHRPLQRIAFNVAVLALVALAAGALIAPVRGESVGAIFAASEIFHSRDNKIPDAGQQDFLTQSAGCQTHTKSATCTVPMLLARRLQTASAWLDCLHALTTSDFHYHSYDD